MEKSSALKYVSQMKPKEHAIMFYSAPADKRLVLFTYLKAGLDQGETSAYVACEESPDHIMDAMVRFGIDVKRLEKKETLYVIHLRNWYIVGGEFSISRTIERWKELYDKSTVKGFKGLRVACETICFFENKMVKELLEYEKALHRVLEFPMTAICAYDSTLWSARAEGGSFWTCSKRLTAG